jgi:hypothetical protein
MAGSSIDSSLAQRRQLLEEALLTDISHMLVTIRNLRTESLEGSKKLNVVILSLLNKFVFGLLNTKSQFIQYDSLTSLDFSEVQLLLQTAQNDLSSKSVQSTLLVTKEVLTDVLPILETDSEVLEIN